MYVYIVNEATSGVHYSFKVSFKFTIKIAYAKSTLSFSGVCSNSQIHAEIKFFMDETKSFKNAIRLS